MARKVVGHEVRFATLHCRADWAHDLCAGVCVVGAHVFGQGDVGQTHLVAVRTGEALRLLGGQHLATVVQFEVGAREDALHRMFGLVAGAGRTLLVAVRAQVVVVADEAFEAPAPEVALQARIAADTWGDGGDDEEHGERKGGQRLVSQSQQRHTDGQQLVLDGMQAVMVINRCCSST